MQPVINESVTCAAFRLRNFIFMVWENKIAAAAVEIKCITEIFSTHRGAFDVPPRTAFAPWAVPRRFIGFGRFPQGKVSRIAFFVIDGHTRARQHVFHIATGKFPVRRKCRDVIVHIAVQRIGVSFRNQSFDHANNVIHVLGYARIAIHPANMQRIHHFKMCYLVTAIFQVTMNHIPGHKRPRVAYMRMIVRRDTAHIHFHFPGSNRLKFFFLLGKRIIYVNIF